MRLYYILETLDPLIMSHSNATTNNHDCFDYIPGSAILGMLAGHYYHDLPTEQSWHLFHSGQCRFGNGYPLVEEDHNDGRANHWQIALPTPASWHCEKTVEPVKNDRYCPDRVRDLCVSYSDADTAKAMTKQYSQCRNGFVTATRQAAVVKKNSVGKTAINGHSGVAADGQLFNYGYIEAGQHFGGWIDCDDPALLVLLKQWFDPSVKRNYRLGRSRNAEFGRVQISLTERIGQADRAVSMGAAKQLVIWCLSDCEIINDLSMPTLSPCGADIHPSLSGATLDRQRSFIRPFCSSRFNQKRQGPDSEQVLIAMGSVLVFDLEQAQPLTEQTLHALQQGIGINRQQGLGWVYLNPSWAEHNQLADEGLFAGMYLDKLTPAIVVANETVADTALLAWIKESVADDDLLQQQQQSVNTLVHQIIEYYQRARRYNNVTLNQAAGPSSSQWQRLFEVFKYQVDNWLLVAFVGEQAICKAKNDPWGWGIDWHSDNKHLTFADAILTLLKDQPLALLRLLLEQLCRYDLSTVAGLAKLQSEYGEAH